MGLNCKTHNFKYSFNELQTESVLWRDGRGLPMSDKSWRSFCVALATL
jgi:hypothetical protein